MGPRGIVWGRAREPACAEPHVSGGVAEDVTGAGAWRWGHWLNAHLVAGLASGAAATLLLHPLDLVKVRFQVCLCVRARAWCD